ncbi:aldo/keto reductase [Jiangella ureilytica]|uniref:Aldo/keto reductase n=1 Tax=Jiangella ureilytica TaxID=2530374 RepID=A0A4R4RV09_9ACTN|nr:aldo/keto reductase family protein [Jiangella ureilytica]TDC53957.1 aldo/keto reductase [Jiangella ureilytica]
MRYRQLGRWGIEVSEITLGTWLTHGGLAAGAAAVACTRRAYELGVNLFDTANVYPEGHEGEAERVLGASLAVFPRDSYLVATKVFSPMGDGPLLRGLSRKHVLAQADASLSRLGLDHIDLYQCHRYDPKTPLEETAAAMDHLVRQGKVLYWGVSEWAAEQLDEVVALCREQRWAVPVSDQPHYSALWREPEASVLPACARHGLGVLAFAPLAHGVLSGKYRAGAAAPAGSRAARPADRWMFDRYLTRSVLAAVAEFQGLAEQAGCSPAQLALAWCLRDPAVSSVVVGASTIAQLEANAVVPDLGIGADVIELADKVLGVVRLS